MIVDTSSKRLTVAELVAIKDQQNIVGLTSTSAITARLIDPIVDFILVGDHAMPGPGHDTTLERALERTIDQARAVVGSTRLACVIADMPFASYRESPQQALRNCAQVLSRSGCDAVKLEGGQAVADTVAFLVERGIAVMAHVVVPLPRPTAWMPDTHAANDKAAAENAWAHLHAGAFGLLLEGLPAPLARQITYDARVPTIGVGGTPGCDGQMMTIEDVLGLGAGAAAPYADVATVIREACERFAADVRHGQCAPATCKPLPRRL